MLDICKRKNLVGGFLIAVLLFPGCIQKAPTNSGNNSGSEIASIQFAKPSNISTSEYDSLVLKYISDTDPAPIEAILSSENKDTLEAIKLKTGIYTFALTMKKGDKEIAKTIKDDDNCPILRKRLFAGENFLKLNMCKIGGTTEETISVSTLTPEPTKNTGSLPDNGNTGTTNTNTGVTNPQGSPVGGKSNVTFESVVVDNSPTKIPNSSPTANPQSNVTPTIPTTTIGVLSTSNNISLTPQAIVTKNPTPIIYTPVATPVVSSSVAPVSSPATGLDASSSDMLVSPNGSQKN